MDSNQQHDSESANTGSSRPADSDVVVDDVLLGAKRIAEHLTSILGVSVDETDVYYAHRMKKLPIGKYGALLIASKRRLIRHAEKLTRGP